MKDLTDISLATKAAVFHDQKAFGRLVVKYQSPVRRFFLTQTHGNEALSDDLAQDTFVKAYTRIGQFRGASSFSTWLYRIAYNIYIDHTRAQHAAMETGHDPSFRVPPAVETGQTPSLRLDLHRALATLTDHERLCVTMQMIDGHTIEEIASVSGMAQGTVKSHLFRGKQKLANYLRSNGYDRERRLPASKRNKEQRI